jgi:hypothetical protein
MSDSPTPAAPSVILTAWNEAYLRAEDYLRATRIGDFLHAHAVVSELLRRAETKAREGDGRHPTELVMEEAMDWLDDWMARALPSEELSEERRTAAGLLAFHAAGCEQRFPSALFHPKPPPACVDALRRTNVRQGPDLVVTSMTPREMDFGAMENITGQPWETYEPLLVAATVGGWALVVFIALRWIW